MPKIIICLTFNDCCEMDFSGAYLTIDMRFIGNIRLSIIQVYYYWFVS